MATRRAALVAAALLLAAAFAALGTWQVERRAWKHALIARVEARVGAAPVDAPGPADWPEVNSQGSEFEYRHVRLRGRFEHDRETLVQAVTTLGAGWWVLTPLQCPDGSTVLVNRGYVPPEHRNAASREAGNPPGEVTVTGLLRLTEPGGAFLRHNDPATGRWTSRDVAAIAAARGLGNAAPYFVDADADPAANPAAPAGGLTVTHFNDPHLVYALTWFGLAAMSLTAVWRLVTRHEQHANRDSLPSM